MTDEEANELLRELLQEAAHISFAQGHDKGRQEALALLAAERVRWIEAVMGELDGNGQAQAIVAHATRSAP